MKPQVGDIVRVKPEHVEDIGWHGGLVTRLVQWPEDSAPSQYRRSLVDCVVFQDPSLINPVQLQTQYVEVISRA